MTVTPTPTPSFEIAKAPDQAAANELVQNILKHDFAITDADMYLASWSVIQKHDEVIEKLTVGKDGFVGFNPLISSLHASHKLAIQLRDQFLNPILLSQEKWLQRRKVFKDACEEAEREKNEAAASLLQKQQAKELEKDARKAEKQGNVEVAEVLRDQAKNLPTPSLPFTRSLAKQPGEVERSGWQFEVQDYAKVPDSFKLLDHTKKGERDLIDSKIRAVVSKLGDKIKIEGIRVWHDTSASSRKV